MRRILAATIVVGAFALFIALAVMTTLRAEAKLPTNSASLLDMGNLTQLRVALVTTGGQVLSRIPNANGVLIQDRRGTIRRVLFGARTVFLWHHTHDRDVLVGADAAEIGAHLSISGLSRPDAFLAFKVRIQPHHRAVGGIIVGIAGAGTAIELLSLSSKRGAISAVRLMPGAAVTLNGRPFARPLVTGLRITTAAVKDPLLPGIMRADSVKVLQPTKAQRVGGLIRTIDTIRDRITIYSKTQNRTYTIEVVQTTKITLSKWKAGYADMVPGDHLTVSGTPDLANTSIGPNPIIAKTIKISSPTFGGTITAIAPAPSGGAVLTVRARRNHMLRIDVPGQTPVLYGTQAAHVPDLFVGAKISVRGTRLGKFEEQATSIRVYPHLHTVGGAIVALLPGLIRITSSTDGSTIIIHTTPDTKYYSNGHATTAAAVKVGLHARIYGYDALRGEQKNIPSLIARRVSLIIRTHTTHSTKKKKATPTKAARPPATATPRAG